MVAQGWAMQTSFLLVAALSMVAAFTPVQAADPRTFELRVYYSNPGKLEELHARFRDHTMRLFEKHGITNLGYWTPLENPEGKLFYVLAYPSREAREKSWKEFAADPDWKSAKAASEKNGALVAKVESSFLKATDFSPEIKASDAGPRVFELRTYTTTEGNLDRLQKRFREHTMSLFQKHGMTNLFYWTLQPDQPNAANTLIYLLAHKSKEAGDASWKAMRADPVWVEAKAASEKEGGGSLTVPDGVKSVFLQATDYSPTK
jgi:L-rhamnose mutarotase